MSGATVNVTVCIATFKRPQLLRALLESLRAQQLPPQVSVRIVVLDNDMLASAREVVEEFQRAAAPPIVYDIEPVQNIALARNRALRHAGGDFVAFIDDDEQAAPDWLAHLLDAALRYNAEVVFGPVIPILPDDAPKWVRRGRFFERKRSPTGTRRRHGGTGNTLVSMNVLLSSGLTFDPAFGLTGGEDTHLFARLGAHGARMIWCEEALVSECVPPQRMTVSWLVRRAFRSGQTFGRIYVSQKPRLYRAAWLLARTFYLFLATFGLFGGVARREWGVLALQKIATNYGQLRYASSRGYEEYRTS